MFILILSGKAKLSMASCHPIIIDYCLDSAFWASRLISDQPCLSIEGQICIFEVIIGISGYACNLFFEFLYF